MKLPSNTPVCFYSDNAYIGEDFTIIFFNGPLNLFLPKSLLRVPCPRINVPEVALSKSSRYWGFDSEGSQWKIYTGPNRGIKGSLMDEVFYAVKPVK